MIQELLQNVLRHSSAWHVWVRINWSASLLKIEVEDDGTGFIQLDDAIASLKRKNNTLRMRAAALGADIKYTTGRAGLLAVIKYPLKSTESRF
jgi:signal transduction histidine kinase